MALAYIKNDKIKNSPSSYWRRGIYILLNRLYRSTIQYELKIVEIEECRVEYCLHRLVELF